MLDLPRAAALSALIGWNQTEADWRLFETQGRVEALDDGGAALAATAATLRYAPHLAWVSMVLVRPDLRRQGHATRLMRWAIENLDGTGCIALDATLAGRPVYERLGFIARSGFARWRLPAPMAAEGITLRPMRPEDLPAVIAQDALAFGAPRAALLADFFARRPQAAFLATDGSFVLARDGHRHPQIGPLVARDAATAQALLTAARHALAEPCVLDLSDAASALRAAIEAAGGVLERPFTRMSLGATLPGDAALSPIFAGPEFG
ncbi:GNAT family N-acetyltransferase [Sediminicoccus sp. KRV36]|uniref:GNAT family N-acetyltransferase n=1 Tax=Sediminicoccus sp. KRV36 TaxID=3133721 RepID=UPI00200C6ADC|nr:GNAT family N-acetyltransferase [Sediminicoccus rosea]UPY34936.1 GNAT family N-acetyltransferase [Sediminicoccus rosea]